MAHPVHSVLNNKEIFNNNAARLKSMKIADLEKEIQDVYLIEDKGIIRIILATIIANKLGLSSKPVWLLILAGSSSGKTALLQTLDKIGDWIIPVDTLTTNTFASGLQRSEEVSLLWKANQGVIVFKDFTTITSMNEEGLREIMGQMRAIYDGSFDKFTGNGADIHWTGKVGILAGGTIATQRKMRQYSEQGERFINYVMKMPDSKEMTRRAIKNQKAMKEKEEYLQMQVATFVNEKISKVQKEELVISKEIEEEMVEVADFCTLARSPVTVDPKTGRVEFVPDREMPPRVAMMLTNIAVALMILCDETELSKENALILYKCAMDSIPVERRIILRLLAQYRGATTKNLAVKLNYPTAPIQSWCNQLNARGIIVRAGTDGTSDVWKIKDVYKKTVLDYEDIVEKNEDLEPTEQELLNNGLTDNDNGYQDPYINDDERLLNSLDYDSLNDIKINVDTLFNEM